MEFDKKVNSYSNDGKKRKEHLQKKVCKFPTCDEIFYGTGKSLYCLEHRKKKYRKIIDKDKLEKKIKDELENSANQIVDHGFIKPEKNNFVCSLEGCNESFDVTFLPNVKVYPKYCNKHRNEFKRKRFLEQNEKK